jgi:hypothetical protein
LSSPRRVKEQITVTGIGDMEGNPSSRPMVSTLATRIDTIIKEMGLTATVTVGGNDSPKRSNKKKKPANSPARNKKAAGNRGTNKKQTQ